MQLHNARQLAANPRSIAAAAAAALLVALAASAGAQAAPAAASDCVAAPSGAAPKGQHWYYHLDRAKNRKCWYLRALDAPVSAAASPPKADATPAPSGATAKATPAAAGITGSIADAPPAAAADAAPAAGAADRAGTIWSDPPPPAPRDVPQSGAAFAGASANMAIATAEAKTASAAAAPDAAAPRDPAPAAAATPVDRPPPASSGSLAENALVIALAGLLAASVFAIWLFIGRRKREPVPRQAPRFGSGPERDAGWLKLPNREAPPLQAGPIESELIPEQVTMPRRSAPRR